MNELGFPINWNDFHFLRPEWLQALWIPLLLLVLVLFRRNQNEKWLSLIAPHLREHMVIKGSRTRAFLLQLGFILSLIIGSVSMAGPSWEQVTNPGAKLQTPLVILLDMSKSMDAEDLQPSRLERALFKIEDLLKSDPRARIALIGYAGSAHTIVPLTSDYEIIRSHLKHLNTGIMPLEGSQLSSAFLLADSVISATNAPGHIMILFDDISEKDQAFLESQAPAASSIYLLPLNTREGSVIYKRKGVAYRSPDGQEIRSQLNLEQLNRINSFDGINLLDLTLDASDMESLAANVRENLEFQEDDEIEKENWKDQGRLLLIPFGLLLLSFFRKGWILFSFLSIGFTSCSIDSTQADWWYTANYQGQKLSDDGNYAEAAETFDDALRKGVAYYKSGQMEKAIESFAEDTSALGKYNLGLAYASTGNFSAAEIAFAEAMTLDPQLEDARSAKSQMQSMLYEQEEADPSYAEESPSEEEAAENIQNQDMEDLGGGGQEATEEDMKKERKEETVSTDIRKGKELEEVPDDIDNSSLPTDQSKILLQRPETDPSTFLKKKFKYQIKKNNIKEDPDANPW